MEPYDRAKLINEIADLVTEIQKMEKKTEMTEYLLNIQPVIYEKSVKSEKRARSSSINKSLDNMDAFLVSQTDNRKTRLLNEYLVATGGCPIINHTEYIKEDFFCFDCNSSNMIVDTVKSSIVCGDCGHQMRCKTNLRTYSQTQITLRNTK